MTAGPLSSDFWVLLSPLFTALAAVILVLTADALLRPAVAVWTAAIGLVVAAGVSIAVGVSYDVTMVFDGSLVVGGQSAYVTAFLFGLAGVIVLGDARRLSAVPNGGAVAALVGFSAVAGAVLAVSRDLAVTVIAIEAVALTGYALVASARSSRSDEAAMKYFIQGAVATGLLLYGSAVLFGLYGAGVRYAEISMHVGAVETDGPILLVLAAIMSVVSFKMSAFPFHSWAPDAFETAPAGPAAALASIPKFAMLFAAVPLFAGVFSAHSKAWAVMFASVAVASILVGNLAALKQTSYQRMLAYSGIAQAGYAFAGFVALGLSSFGVRLFAVTYVLGIAAAFLGAQAVRDLDEGWDGTIHGLAGLGSRHPFIAACISVSVLSLTGIPLTAGFWGKFWVFLLAAQSGWAWLAIVGFVGSVVSFGYYGTVLKAMYLETPTGEGDVRRSAPSVWALTFLAAVILAVGLLPLFAGAQPLIHVIGA